MAQSPFADKLWLAPLTVGGNLPFRRLCVEFGADVTVGEMAVVKKLLSNSPAEFALLRSHPSEPFFGAQLADKKPETLALGAQIAEARGARFIDLNCGCPINEITRRGLGASLLQKPAKLGRLVAAMKAAVRAPVTVKLRVGWAEGKENVRELARVCEESGAAAITIHGRTREQRYSRAADWDLIGQVAAERTVPVVGNGDILTHFEARTRMARSGVRSVMLARGALIKPWLFREIKEGREWLPTAEERFRVLWRLREMLFDHFGADERGQRRVRRFLPWHLNFLCRYRPFPESEFAAQAEEHPLLQTRPADTEPQPPLEALLRDGRASTHEALAGLLLESATVEEAVEKALALQETIPAAEAPSDLQVAASEVAG
jgi:tRNA-dihydrouridine synthase 3